MPEEVIFDEAKMVKAYQGKMGAVSSTFKVEYGESTFLRLQVDKALKDEITLSLMVDVNGMCNRVNCGGTPLVLGNSDRGTYHDTLRINDPGTYHLLFLNTPDTPISDEHRIQVVRYYKHPDKG